MVDFLVLHREYELRAGEHDDAPAPIQAGVQSSGKQWDYLTSKLGALLGTDIYDAYLEGRLTRAVLRHLFLMHLEEPGSARQAYFAMARKARSLKKRSGSVR
jgi:hypothetical protein